MAMGSIPASPRWLGILFFTAGLGLGVIAPRFTQEHLSQLASLDPMTLAQLSQTAVGTDVVIEGTLSRQMPTVVQGLVAYRLEAVDRDTKGRSHWDTVKRYTPPLLVDVSDGVVRISNDTYLLQDVPIVGSESKDRRYRGLKPGDQILAVGTLTANQILNPHNALPISADFVAAGSKTSYLAAEHQEVWILRAFGLLFAGVGIFFLRVPRG